MPLLLYSGSGSKHALTQKAAAIEYDVDTVRLILEAECMNVQFLVIILKVIRGFRIQYLHYKPVSNHICSNYVQEF
jgi:hypothetical protein